MSKSKVSVIYNDKLKQFLREADEIFYTKKEQLVNDISFNSCLEQLQNHFKDNLEKLDFIEKINKNNPMFLKPNIFALIVALSSDYENHEYWDTLFNRSIIKQYLELPDEDYTRCICCQKIKRYCVIQINDTGINLPVGVECVRKHLLTNEEQKEDFKKSKKEFKYIQKLKEKYRTCIDCNEYKIDKTQPEWRVRCNKCYYNFKNTEN